MDNNLMIYLTGANGMIGKRFKELYDKPITNISYRKKVPKNLFESHDKSCLIHLGWSSTTRTSNIDQIERDVYNSKKLFEYYLEKNPDGKIIFVSTAGDMHQSKVDDEVNTELSEPRPRTLYGQSKLKVERILERYDCKTITLRVTNVWGGSIGKNRVNGLVDKLINAVDTDNQLEIYANFETTVNLVHIDDVINIILKTIDIDLDKKHELFLVGGQTVSIYDIISKVSRMGSLNLKINQKEREKTFINVKSLKAKKIFNWNREFNL